MFRQKPKRKLDSRVRYQGPQFRQKLAKARTYRRPVLQGYAVNLRGYAYTLKKYAWPIGAVVVLVSLFCTISFVPGLLYIRKVEVQGGSEELNSEVRQETLRYVSGRHLLILPRINLLYVGPRTLESYITAANPHVWKVESVSRVFPHTLRVSISARVPTFVWEAGGTEILLANDGTVLPANEPGASNMLRLTGLPGHTLQVGERYLQDLLLGSLLTVKNSFTDLTGLPTPSSVELIPVVVLHDSAVPPVATGTVVTAPVVQLPTKEVLDVPAQEIRVAVPPEPSRSGFVLLLSVNDHVTERLVQVRTLLAAQSPERLRQLVYVDMRTPGKAFICLAGAPCATDFAATPPIVP